MVDPKDIVLETKTKKLWFPSSLMVSVHWNSFEASDVFHAIYYVTQCSSAVIHFLDHNQKQKFMYNCHVQWEGKCGLMCPCPCSWSAQPSEVWFHWEVLLRQAHCYPRLLRDGAGELLSCLMNCQSFYRVVPFEWQQSYNSSDPQRGTSSEILIFPVALGSSSKLQEHTGTAPSNDLWSL